jgi:hypothetical protein
MFNISHNLTRWVQERPYMHARYNTIPNGSKYA